MKNLFVYLLIVFGITSCSSDSLDIQSDLDVG